MRKVDRKPLTNPTSQFEVVTLAVFLLGGDQRPVDTEDVAVKAHELAPGRFAWRKYPDQINLELIRVFLSDAKKPKNGAMLDGSGDTGWSLTPAGLQWAKKAAEALPGKDLARRREDGRGGGVKEQRWRRERERILRTKAWEMWSSGNRDVSVRDAEDVFRIDAYAVGRMRNLKITRLRALFDEADQVQEFLKEMSSIISPAGEQQCAKSSASV